MSQVTVLFAFVVLGVSKGPAKGVADIGASSHPGFVKLVDS